MVPVLPLLYVTPGGCGPEQEEGIFWLPEPTPHFQVCKRVRVSEDTAINCVFGAFPPSAFLVQTQAEGSFQTSYWRLCWSSTLSISFPLHSLSKGKLLTCKALQDPPCSLIPLISCPPPPSFCSSHTGPLAVPRQCQAHSLLGIFALAVTSAWNTPFPVICMAHHLKSLGSLFQCHLSITKPPCHPLSPSS